MTKHLVSRVRRVGKYDLCADCLRGVIQSNGIWNHARRVAWTGK